MSFDVENQHEFVCSMKITVLKVGIGQWLVYIPHTVSRNNPHWALMSQMDPTTMHDYFQKVH